MKGTIKSTEEISSLFQKAQRTTTSNFIALAERRERDKRGAYGRLAFVAGKRLGSAPQRNRAKRLMREAARKAQAPWEAFDVVFVAREKIITATLDMVLKDMEHVKRRLVGNGGR